MINRPEREGRVIQLLKRAANIWPDSLWIFAADGKLIIMHTGRDGERIMTQHGGYDPAYQVEDINIPSDGGDW